VAQLADSLLEQLDLSGTKVTTASVPVFKTMYNLKRLGLPSWNKFVPLRQRQMWSELESAQEERKMYRDLESSTPGLHVYYYPF